MRSFNDWSWQFFESELMQTCKHQLIMGFCIKDFELNSPQKSNSWASPRGGLCSLLPQIIFLLPSPFLMCSLTNFSLLPKKWLKMIQCSLLHLLFQYMLPAPSFKKWQSPCSPITPRGGSLVRFIVHICCEFYNSNNIMISLAYYCVYLAIKLVRFIVHICCEFHNFKSHYDILNLLLCLLSYKTSEVYCPYMLWVS